MAKLYFRYGAMGSSKTANALMVKFNYEDRGKRALLLKPSVDTRDGERVVRSRTGLEAECVLTSELDSINIYDYDAVIVDEAQFLTEDEVLRLVHIVDSIGIPVMCYGLRADFKGDLFTGSHALLRFADSIEEIKTVCWCGKKAISNARLNDHGRVIKDGEQIVLGGNDRYIALCRKHWMTGVVGESDSEDEQVRGQISVPAGGFKKVTGKEMELKLDEAKMSSVR